MAVNYSTAAQTPSPKPLSAKQLRAVLELANGETQAQTAQTVGVSPQTVCKWASLPEFQNLVQDLIAQRSMTADEYMQHKRMQAVRTLTSLMENAPPATRLRAARALLDYTTPEYDPDEEDLIQRAAQAAIRADAKLFGSFGL
jgi:hypothetical protein